MATVATYAADVAGVAGVRQALGGRREAWHSKLICLKEIHFPLVFTFSNKRVLRTAKGKEGHVVVDHEDSTRRHAAFGFRLGAWSLALEAGIWSKSAGSKANKPQKANTIECNSHWQ